MSICYDKLWKLLIDKKMNRTELKEASGISFNVLARLGKNEPVSFESIEKICFTLNCKIEEVVEIQKEEPLQIDSDAFKTIELFAGAGGLALGIEKAGFESLGLIEFDKDAAESLKKNRPNWRVIHDDIANISCLDLEDYFDIKKGELDLLSGGAPCQAFSYAGKRLGLEDARGTLFYHYATFLQKLQPKMFLFENVRGLLTHDKGRTFATIQRILEGLGYTFFAKVLNSAHYGVPQTRNRTYIVCFANENADFAFPESVELTTTLQDLLEKDVDDKYFLSERILPTILSNGTGGYVGKSEIDLKIARPLCATMAKMHRACQDNYVTQNDRVRRLVPRECARLQGFDDDFVIPVSDSQAYKQFGNAVTVNVSDAVAREVRRTLEILGEWH